MQVKQFIKNLFDAGKKAGIEDMEVFIQGSSKLELMVFKGEIDKFSKAQEKGLSFRGLYQGKMGYSYTEKIDEASIEFLIDDVISNAKIIDSDEQETIFKGSDHYNEVNTFNLELEQKPIDKKIEFIKLIEKEALSLDDRVESINYCLYGDQKRENMIVNTKGVNLESKVNSAYMYISAVVKEDNDIKSAVKYKFYTDFNKFDYKAIAKDVVNEALSLLGAESIKSDNYPVILRNNVAARILKGFSGIFSADDVQKGLSLLKGKLNKKIASERITIVDDPFMEDGIETKSFDSEGVATKFKKVINKGVLKTYLHNSKTAKKDGVQSTGNAFKSSYKAPITIAPTNMYIEKGNKELDEMVKEMQNGLLIIDVQGMNSGLNPVSGDFSLAAAGYEIKEGKINKPVSQITIAGNLFELLNDVEDIGHDLVFLMPLNGYIGSPSLKIKSLSVAGE